MRNITLKRISIIILLSFSLLSTTAFSADIGAKGKALGLATVYGTVGGALLGTAAMGLGHSERAIAVGASLGLYAGMLFGGYVVLSYKAKKYNWNLSSPRSSEPAPLYDDTDTPYNDESNESNESMYNSYFRSSPKELIEIETNLDRLSNRKALDIKTFYVNIVNYRF